MHFIRQGFYLILGLTFPAFWIIHASGTFGFLYLPLQKLSGSSATGWPSFITASLIYIACTILVECCFRSTKKDF